MLELRITSGRFAGVIGKTDKDEIIHGVLIINNHTLGKYDLAQLIFDLERYISTWKPRDKLNDLYDSRMANR